MTGLILLGLLLQQAPAPCSPSGNVQFVCGQEAPEDLAVLPGSDWVFASDFSGNGGIRLINTRDFTTTMAYPAPTAKDKLDAKTYDSCPGAPDVAEKAKFRTHGLALRPGKNSLHTLYTVHHGNRESVEIFEVDARGKIPALTWIGCAVAPEPIGLNEVVPLPDGGFAATNFLARSGPGADRTKMMAGEKNGEIWEWQTAKGWKVIPGSEAAGANGLEVSKTASGFTLPHGEANRSSVCHAGRHRQNAMKFRSGFESITSVGPATVPFSLPDKQARRLPHRQRTS